MTDRRSLAGQHSHRRRDWTRFWVLSAVALGAAVAVDLAYGGGDHLVVVLAIGLCLIGITAFAKGAPVSREQMGGGVSGAGAAAGWSFAGGGGVTDGGGSGGGGGGDGGC
jgi:hypothetical protein